ncbi:MAG TPA: phasin family protein [Acetobacteraceae bacterium]|nr:phasin family protein [Acetobacteraceae bacterium]
MSSKTKLVDAGLTPDSSETSAPAQEFGNTMSEMKDGMEKAALGFEASQGKMKEGLAKAMKTTEEFVAFGQGNLEAAVKSAQILANGLQDLSKHIAGSTQSSFEESVATLKAISGVKSFREALDLQASYTRSMMEKAVAETGKLTDASLKLTEQTIAPITARISLAVEKFSNAA